MLNHYECLVLFDSSKISGNQDAAKLAVTTTLQKYGAEILVARNWDERKLSYPINGQKKGLYFLAYFKADSLKIDPIQGDFKINEQILRFTTLKVPAKWETELMAVAMDEHAFAYQALREEGGDSMGIPELEEGNDRPRRGRRSDEPMKG